MGSRVLDASAFYAGVPFGGQGTWYTTPEVLEEVDHIRGRQDLPNTMAGSGRLQVRIPSAESVDRAKRAAAKTGDGGSISEQDVSVVALAAEMGGSLVTDDFAVSNVAASMGIKVEPVMTGGIRRQGRWTYYCPACKKTHKARKSCPVCATPLRRSLSGRRASSGR